MEDKSQYHPPRTVYNQELYSIIEQSAASHTPEKIHAPFQFAKDIEAIMDSCRDTIEALEQKNGREFTMKYIPVTFVRAARPHDKIIKELLESERLESTKMPIGGQIGKYCVHYGGKVVSPYSTPDIGHWYVEEMVNGIPGTGPVTHYETHKDHVKKFNDQGQRVEVNLAELSVLAHMFYDYPRAVMPKLYPIDFDRTEVILDGIDFPDNVSLLVPPEHHEQRAWTSDKHAA